MSQSEQNINLQQSALSGGITLASLFGILRQRSKFIIGIALLGAACIAAYSLVMPQTFQATATILPPEGEKAGGLSSLLQSATGAAGLDIGSLAGASVKSQLYVDILKSRTVAEAVIEACSLRVFHTFQDLNRDKALRQMRSMIDIETNSTGLIFVTAEVPTGWLPADTDIQQVRQLSASIANTAIATLDSINRAKNTSSARRAKEYLDKALADHKSRLQQAQLALEEFSKKNKVLLLEEQTAAVVKNAIEVGTELARTDIELQIAKSEFSSATPVVSALVQKRENLLKQYSQIQDGGLVADDAFSIPLTEVPALARQYADLVREAKTLEKITVYLETQRAQEAIQEQRDIPTVQVLDAAVPPEDRISPRRGIMVIMGFLLTAFLATLSAIIGEARKNRLHDVIQLH